MKKIALISAIAISSLLYNSANAQIRVHLGLHFGLRPVYAAPRVVVEAPAPVQYVEPANYEGDEDYYYLPDVDAYYSVPEQCYYYNDGGQWISAEYLPGAYHDFDWRSARRFEIRALRPFMHNDYYRTRFNGVAFNGRWNDRNFNNGYADNHFNHDQYRNDDQRFDNNRRDNGYTRQYDQNKVQPNFDRNRGQDNRQFNQNRDRNIGSAQEHFAQNMPQRNDRGARGDHRSARF